MSEKALRVAYFTDSYLEVDGVANTARQFEAYIRRKGLPFLMVYGGYEKEKVAEEANLTKAEFPRSGFGFVLDRKHEFDLAFLRHTSRVTELVSTFKPDVLHITGPSDVGILGAVIAHRLKIPLVGSWHTNLHQYAERRALPLLCFLPRPWQQDLAGRIRDLSFRATARFYHIPRVLMAPNQELVALLEKAAGKPCFLMGRGVDTELFHPCKRERFGGRFTIGYVGRITTEKNIEALVEVERLLIACGVTETRFLIVGQGSGENYLRSNLKNAEFTGVLTGEALARAYANMDIFLFPSKTDTFGNVVLEALASAVPVLVTDEGGPQFIVRNGETGFICRDNTSFADRIQSLKHSPQDLAAMRMRARRYAEGASWDAIFEAVYRAYKLAIDPSALTARMFNAKLPARIQSEA
jgi:glycosyltransferase involved in cell wall biosynthesis